MVGYLILSGQASLASLRDITLNSGESCQIYYGAQRYSSIVSLRGDGGGLHNFLFVSGYGVSTIRNNVTFVSKNHIKLYTDNTSPTTLYVTNTGSARQKMSILNLIGGGTIEYISSIPSTAEEMT